MHLSAIAVTLAGAIMLLLYSTRMVRTGIERASGPSLRSLLLDAGNGRIRSAVAGAIAACLLQSSTAVALLVSGFATTGIVATTCALAIVLGADLGTAIVVQFLSLDLSALIPALLAVGGLLFLKFDARTARQIGRVLIGIAFILISLGMIGEATAPLRHSAYLPAIVQVMSEDVLIAFFGGAALAFLFHSSVAAILLFAAFCSRGVLPIEAALPLVLGANAGGGLVAVWLTRSAQIEARHITTANFVFRLFGGLLVLATLASVEVPISWLGTDAVRQLVNFHLLFNAALVVLCLPLVGPAIRLAEALIQESEELQLERLRPASALEHGVIDMPNLALASVKRELLRMSEIIEVMARPVMDVFAKTDARLVNRIRTLDADVDQVHLDIKFYIAELSRGKLTDEEMRRAVELISVAVNLERVGDIIVKDLLPLASQKHDRALKFSDAGWREITAMHARIMANMQLALNVLVSEDLDTARQLVEEKDMMRRMERESYDNHMARLGGGNTDSRSSSNLHMETIRALKEINSCFATIAYPTLEKHGILLHSRLAEEDTIHNSA